MGHMESGETLTITVEYEDGDVASINSLVYGFDDGVWQKAYEMLADETLNVTFHDDTKVEGTITAKEAGMCVISIPYEKGWNVKVDGKPADVSLLGDALIAVPLTEGTHEIKLTFLPYGFAAGIAVTMLGLGIFITMCVLKKRKSLNN